MRSREAFGPNLRRIRIRRGVSLATIARVTKVPVALWEALEDNDLYGWPSGVYARAYIREYARLVGVDPEETVNEFCRLFPQGDRRRQRLLTEHPAVVGEGLAWSDDVPMSGDRRAAAAAPPPPKIAAHQLRLMTAAADVACVLLVTAAASAVLSTGFAVTGFWLALLYLAASIAVVGQTPASLVADAYRSQGLQNFSVLRSVLRSRREINTRAPWHSSRP